MLDPDFLALLRCPQTMQPLRLLTTAELAHLNASRTPPIEAGLLRADGQVVFPVVQGIPVMLLDEAIRLT